MTEDEALLDWIAEVMRLFEEKGLEQFATIVVFHKPGVPNELHVWSNVERLDDLIRDLAKGRLGKKEDMN